MAPEGPRIGLLAARLGAGAAVAVGAFLVLRPFLVPLAWAAMVALLTWPLYRRARTLTGRPGTTALLFTLGVFVVLGVPFTIVLANLAGEGTRLVEGIERWIEAGTPAPGWIARSPWLAAGFEELRQIRVLDPRQIGSWIQSYGSTVSGQVVGLASAVAGNVFSLLVMGVGLAIFYRDGDALALQAKRLAPVLLPYADEGFVERVGATLRAVVIGLLGTALVQGILAGIGFALFGVALPVALGALTFLASFVPAGTVLVWVPVALWLLIDGRTVAAIGLALWGSLVVSSTDNWLRPLLISGPARIPFLLVFLGVLGGLSAFGLVGLFVGPVLLSLAFTLLAEFGRPEHLEAAVAAEGASAGHGPAGGGSDRDGPGSHGSGRDGPGGRQRDGPGGR